MIRKLLDDLWKLAAIGAVLTVLFIIGDLIIYGRVKW